MEVSKIAVGDRVLVQSSEFVKEHGTIKGFNLDNGCVFIRLSDYRLVEMMPKYIINSFGQ